MTNACTVPAMSELSLPLVWPSNCGCGSLTRDDRDQAFADVVAGEVFLHVLEEAQRLAGGVDGAGERGAEAGEVGAAVDGVDVVGEGEDGLGVGVVVLQRDLHGDVVALGLHVDGLLVQDLLALVQVLDELGDAAGVLEVCVLGFAGLGVGGALVGEGDLEALVEEGELAQALGEGVVVVLGDGEDGLVGQEVDLGAPRLDGAHLAERWRWGRPWSSPAPRRSRRARSRRRTPRESALTQQTPTPCRPPETL